MTWNSSWGFTICEGSHDSAMREQCVGGWVQSVTLVCDNRIPASRPTVRGFSMLLGSLAAFGQPYALRTLFAYSTIIEALFFVCAEFG